MSLQKQTQIPSQDELRDEHKNLVLEQERLEEQTRKLQDEVKQTEPSKKS